VRDALRRALDLAGYEVQIAPAAVPALGIVRERPPDAIVLDVLMPGMDGIELCRLLRADGDRTPVLMLTARDAVSDRVAGLDAGADDYLVKPFAPPTTTTTECSSSPTSASTTAPTRSGAGSGTSS
jgi:two-component system response regulator MprA